MRIEHEIERSVNRWTKREIFQWVHAIRWRRKADKAVALVLARRSDGSGECFPSCKQIALELACSLDTVHRAVKRLIDTGVLVRKFRNGKRGHRISNLYTLNVGHCINFWHSPKPQIAVKDNKRLNRKKQPPKPQNAATYNKHSSQHLEEVYQDSDTLSVESSYLSTDSGVDRYTLPPPPEFPATPPYPLMVWDEIFDPNRFEVVHG